MKKIGLLILLVAFAGLGCAARRDAMERGAGARVKAAALLPARGEVVGWKPEGKVRGKADLLLHKWGGGGVPEV